MDFLAAQRKCCAVVLTLRVLSGLNETNLVNKGGTTALSSFKSERAFLCSRKEKLRRDEHGSKDRQICNEAGKW